jgi:hypothetical protein
VISRRLDRLVAIAVLCCSACADELVGPLPAEFEPLCGQDQPLRLLELDAGLPLEWVAVRRHTQRFSIRLSREQPGFVTELWTVDPCGEHPAPFELASVGWVEFAQWPDRVFECLSGTEIRGHDIDGERPPVSFVIRDVCELFTELYPVEVPGGLLSIAGEGSVGPLVLQRWSEAEPSAPVEQIVLADIDLDRSDPHESLQDELLAVADGTVFTITSEAQLLAISLADLSSEVLASEVRQLEVDASGRYVVWQSTAVSAVDDWVEGPIYLHDRSDGTTVQIGDTALDYSAGHSLDFASVDLAFLADDLWGETGVHRWIELASGDPVELPAAGWPLRPVGDHHIVFHHYDHATMQRRFDIVDLDTGALELVVQGQFAAIRDDAAGLSLLREPGGELLFVDYAGHERVLAHHAHPRWLASPDGRVITPLTETEDAAIGRLVLIDPVTLDERFIATGVLVNSVALLEHESEVLLTYAIVEGDQAGVWLARLQ